MKLLLPILGIAGALLLVASTIKPDAPPVPKPAPAGVETNAASLVTRVTTADGVKTSSPAPKTTSKAIPLTPAEQKRFEEGKGIYEATCLACHQQHGLGQEGLAPPLVNSTWTTGSPERIARIVLHGLRGPITVLKQTYELEMPPLGVLDDDQIAAVITYVRREWGHTASPMTPADIARIRQKESARDESWTALELLKLP